jgi:glycosyltransferase involved in cell wall biosynthesis
LTILVFSYNRPDYLAACLESLRNTYLPKDVTIHIIDDHSNAQTKRIIKAFKCGCNVVKTFKTERAGLYDSILFGHDTAFQDDDFVITLSDDCIVNNYFYDYFDYYRHIFPLNIISGFNSLTLSENGTPRHPVLYNHGWFISKITSGSLAMGINRFHWEQYFRPTIIARMKRGKSCYDTIATREAHYEGYGVICTVPSVCEHTGTKSTMGHGNNPDISCDFQRNYHPRDQKKTIVSVNIATYPPRIECLKKLITHLLKIKLIDRIRVYLNEYTEIPAFLQHPKITAYIGENRKDSGKFFWAQDYKDEIYFTLDDDLLPVPEYFQCHIDLLNEYDGSVFITLHGKVLRPNPSSFTDHTEKYHCLYPVFENHFVNLPGTGVMAFDNLNYKIPDIFHHDGMADLWIAKYCQQNKIPCIVRAHDDELELIYTGNDTLWNKHSKMKRQHAEILNSITWKLYTLEA